MNSSDDGMIFNEITCMIFDLIYHKEESNLIKNTRFKKIIFRKKR